LHEAQEPHMCSTGDTNFKLGDRKPSKTALPLGYPWQRQWYSLINSQQSKFLMAGERRCGKEVDHPNPRIPTSGGPSAYCIARAP
jgi:hypothetical protein